jgi:hypothetical protein
MPKLESSKFRHAATAFLTYGIATSIIAIHSETNLKIDIMKTGGISYFFQTLTSLDITQPASVDNIDVNTKLMTTFSLYPANKRRRGAKAEQNKNNVEETNMKFQELANDRWWGTRQM